MVSVLLGIDTLSTVGDKTGTVLKLWRRVPEGSPLSPAIFNLYIDVLGFDLKKIPREISAWPSNIFADDVQFISLTSEGLQKLLDIFTTWAKHYGLVWVPENQPQESSGDLLLANSVLPHKQEARYLGITITAYGSADSELKKRRRAAKSRVEQLKSCGLINKWHPQQGEITIHVSHPTCV